MLEDFRSRPLPAHAAAISRSWPGQRIACVADRRMPDAPAGAFRTRDCGGHLPRFSADSVFRSPHHLCASVRHAARGGATDRRIHAAIRVRLGAVACAGARTIPGTVRALDPGALWDDRNTHEYRQSLHGGTPAWTCATSVP